MFNISDLFRFNFLTLIFISAIILILSNCQLRNNSELFILNENQIIGGQDVTDNDLISKSTVLIYHTLEKTICTGTLIGMNMVLTAAHCLKNDPSKIVVIFARNIKSVTKEKVRTINNISLHPNFKINKNLSQNKADIALFKYVGNTPSDYSPSVFLSDFSFIKKGYGIFIAGFGISDLKQQQSVGILRKAKVLVSPATLGFSEIEINQNNNTSACYGDSGGPAYIILNNQTYIWGVSSRGNEIYNGQCRTKSFYTNTLFYYPWIKEQSQKMASDQSLEFKFSE